MDEMRLDGLPLHPLDEGHRLSSWLAREELERDAERKREPNGWKSTLADIRNLPEDDEDLL